MKKKDTSQFRYVCATKEQYPELMKTYPELVRPIGTESAGLALQCPDLPDDFPIIHAIISPEGKAAVWMRAMTDTFFTPWGVFPVSCQYDIFTFDEFRRMGLALRLFDEYTKAELARGYFPAGAHATPVTMHIVGKVGHTVSAYVPVHFLFRDHRVLLDRLELPRGTKWAAGGMLDLARRAGSVVARRRKRMGGYRLEVVDPERLAAGDLPWPPQVYDFPLHFDHRPEYLAWKMKVRDMYMEGECRFYQVVRRSDGRPACYLLVRDDTRLQPSGDGEREYGLLAALDLGFYEGHRGDYSLALEALLELFYTGPHHVLKVIDNAPRMINGMRRRGFIWKNKGMGFHAAPMPGWENRPLVHDAANYRLTDFFSNGITT